MISVAIDGPGGAGKSTAARAAAERTGLKYMDTGAIYRSLGIYLRRSGVDINREEAVAAALPALFLCIGLLEPLAAFFRDAIAVSKLSGVYTGPLLKCMTISILTMIGESLCKDAGQAAGACAVQLVGVAAALYAALPLMRTFLTMIGECL